MSVKNRWKEDKEKTVIQGCEEESRINNFFLSGSPWILLSFHGLLSTKYKNYFLIFHFFTSKYRYYLLNLFFLLTASSCSFLPINIYELSARGLNCRWSNLFLLEAARSFSLILILVLLVLLLKKIRLQSTTYLTNGPLSYSYYNSKRPLVSKEGCGGLLSKSSSSTLFSFTIIIFKLKSC